MHLVPAAARFQSTQRATTTVALARRAFSMGKLPTCESSKPGDPARSVTKKVYTARHNK
eukprot:CAMPEP_0206619412 /NCGR_PEP_ID=MMETSP0325_2-20121206/60808_1 /ASSEMBLY_ACC=CAM_ASM_000347 /TAXON_ID=2866 /ORGANISM="Crypthecodinium cohnii, Strain Seligo" /LENGTH=58 /DNA_ID=CAMNT_0054141767 /DNA_START=1 /DNA_END=177 /DNA_ORIENTATION=+